MVGETGLAPAWAFAREFLRLECIRSTTRRKNWCGRSELHAHAPSGAAVFKTARSTVVRRAARTAYPPLRSGLRHLRASRSVHARPPDWSRRSELHRHGQSRPAGFESAVFPNFTTPRMKIGADRGNRTLMGSRPSAPRADVSTVPPRPQKTGASTGTCAPLSALPRQSVAIYGLDAWSKRKDLHLRSPSGHRVYSALHLLLCHASKEMGARAGIAPATVSL